MPRMIDMVRNSSVPASMMRLAARGALSVPPSENVEILVHLARHNPMFAEQAELTLAGWKEADLRSALADASISPDVMEYFADSRNIRPALLPSLLCNPSLSEDMLVRMAAEAGPEAAKILVSHERIAQSSRAADALKANPRSGLQLAAASSHAQPGALASTDAGAGGDEEVNSFLKDNAAEIAAEADKPFQPIGGIYNESEATESDQPAEAAAEAKPPEVAAPKKQEGNERGSVLSKINSLNITGRIQLAMKGSKEERSILIRDGTKIVALAVLQSPKITDGEVEKFASQKNVLEAVLRAIPMKRQFAKNYIVVRNLVANPRTPLDVALGLMKNLLPNDLKNLSGNKEVAETIRKLALRQFKQKTEAANKK